MGNKKGLGIITNDKPEYIQQVLDHTDVGMFDVVYIYDSSGDRSGVIESMDISGGGNSTDGELYRNSE